MDTTNPKNTDKTAAGWGDILDIKKSITTAKSPKPHIPLQKCKHHKAKIVENTALKLKDPQSLKSQTGAPSSICACFARFADFSRPMDERPRALAMASAGPLRDLIRDPVRDPLRDL